MRTRFGIILLVCVGAVACLCGCATTQTDTGHLDALQSQLIEMQKSQTALAARMDEIQNTLLVLEEANRLTKAQLEGIERRSGTRPFPMRSDPAPAPAESRAKTPTPAETPEDATAGKGGEYVSPPPKLDPTLAPVLPPSPSPGPAAADRTTCRIEPEADLLDDAGFAKAWATHRAGKYAVGIFDWNEVIVASRSPRLTAAARYYLADAYFALKEYDQAGALFDAVAGQPEAAGFRACAAFRVGRCLELRGKTDAAAKQYEAVIRLYPGTGVAGSARTRLTDMESTTSH